MIAARVQTASTSSRMWVEITIALSGLMSRIRDRTWRFWLGSSPSVGSSRIRDLGVVQHRLGEADPAFEPLGKRIDRLMEDALKLDHLDRAPNQRRGGLTREAAGLGR